jgi:protein-S-isoprenylcysteine O-methyltransferase Ste14
MDQFEKWAAHEHSKRKRILIVVLGGVFFWIFIPLFILISSYYLDQWLRFPSFRHGSINFVIGLILMGVGWFFANWTVKVQFTIGRGTPIPLVATQKLLTKGPYAYCRNPMAFGTDLFYIGLGIWSGSFSAIVLGLIYPVGIVIYIKFIEEKELQNRFGFEYLEYKERTSFIIPAPRKKR